MGPCEGASEVDGVAGADGGDVALHGGRGEAAFAAVSVAVTVPIAVPTIIVPAVARPAGVQRATSVPVAATISIAVSTIDIAAVA